MTKMGKNELMGFFHIQSNHRVSCKCGQADFRGKNKTKWSGFIEDSDKQERSWGSPEKWQQLPQHLAAMR